MYPVTKQCAGALQDYWIHGGQTPLDMAFSFLQRIGLIGILAVQNLKWFLAECWEKKFHHFKADEARKAVLDGLFTCASLADILKKREQPGGPGPFVFGLDLNAAKYVNGVRETPNGEVC